MAAHTILTIKQALVSLDGEEYADAIDNVTLAVTYETTEWVPVSGAVQSSVGQKKHVLNLNLGQSMTNGELMHTLYTEHGNEVPFSIRPLGSTTPAITGTCVITAPAQIGGGVGIATTSATLPVKGDPLITWATGA